MRVLLKISPFNAMTGFENLHQVVCQNLYLCEETFKFDSSTLKVSYLGERQSQLTTTVTESWVLGGRRC